MRILIVTVDFPPIEGGISSITVHLAQYLHQQGVEVVVMAPYFPGIKNWDKKLPYPVVRFRGYGWGYFRLFPLLIRYPWVILKFKPQVILASNIAYGGILGLLSKTFLSLPYVTMTYAYEFLKFSRFKLLDSFLLKVLSYSDRVVAISQFSQGKLVERGLRKDKIYLIPLGVDLEKFYPTSPSPSILDKYGLRGKKVLLTVARLVERKGVDMVMKALLLVQKEIPDVVYLVVGRGSYGKRLESLRSKLGLEKKVIFAGYVPHTELAPYYNSADIFIMPNREGKEEGQVEGFGLVFLEAGACGKPVIGGRSGGTTDAILHGKTGLLVDPQDEEDIAGAIIKLLRDNQYARRLGEEGRKRVGSKYNWDNTAKHLREVLEEARWGKKGRKIKVLHVITRMVKGGAQENTLSTVKALDKNRYEVLLVSGPSEGSEGSMEEEITREGIPWVKIPELVRHLHPGKDFIALGKLFSLIKREKFDIVHTHTSKAGILGRWAAWLAGAPVIIHTPHGHIFYGYFGRISTRLFVFLERLTARITDKIIVLTEMGKREHIKEGIAPEGKFLTVPSGVELEKFLSWKGRGEESKRRLGISTQTLVVGTVGRLVPVKGHKYLLIAASQVLQKIPGVLFLIVGKGPLREELGSQARSLGISSQVLFMEDEQDVPSVMGAMDLFVLPSLNEGMGRVLIQTMAMGKPVVATQVGGIPEIVRGENGILVPPENPDALAEAIVKLLQDENLRKKMGEAGGKLVYPRFSQKYMIEQLDSLYMRMWKR